jgi:crotonobetainyl-CoA:carnitine CoA-transferase CaiB-like acyl-CoA transferase
MKALDGVRILDFTHVQSGPTCTQLLAWFGAEVIKVERPGVGDITRGQLRDIPDVDSLYFTMLNANKKSITLDTKNEDGKRVLERLVQSCDVLVENFAPGALDRMGFSWDRIQELNPRMIYASVKGFGPGPYEDCKVYENVAQSRGRRSVTAAPASTWRWASSRRSSSARRADAASGCWRRCRTGCSTSPASSCATSSAWRTGRSRNTRSTPTASSPTSARAPATPRAAASRAGP